MGFTLTYDLEGAGWAMARIQDGDAHLDISVSYLHDSLREMAEAARALLSGAECSRVIFMDEPGEIHLVLYRSHEALRYDARWFDDWSSWGMCPADTFRIVYSGETTVRRFVGEVRKEMEALLRDHGKSGYKEKWIEHEFPEELLIELQQELRAEPRAAANGGSAASPDRSNGGDSPAS